jgi:hypothetical protein
MRVPAATVIGAAEEEHDVVPPWARGRSNTRF